jgi:enoyl-CoA hydratase/carnithine racemase
MNIRQWFVKPLGMATSFCSRLLPNNPSASQTVNGPAPHNQRHPSQFDTAPTKASMPQTYETLKTRQEGAVLFAEINAPPMNLIGPELIRDLVSLIEVLDRGDPYKVVVFSSGDPDFFIAHVDVTKIGEYRAAAAKLTGEASIGMLFRRLSQTNAVTIAQVESRVRGAGSEFVMACDMIFAAKETAIFSQMEAAFGLVPGGGAVQHLTRLLGRARALEVLLSADDYDADLAERYNWINRALPAAELAPFVSKLAHRIAKFPAAGHRIIKERVNAIALAPAEDFRRDSALFGEAVRDPDAQHLVQAAIKLGYNQSPKAELNLADLLGNLPE